MSASSYTIHSRLYQRFKSIEPTDFRRIIAFVEQNKKYVFQLDGETYAEIAWVYSNALFGIGDYWQVIRLSDELIAYVMEHNIVEINGERIFESILCQKGMAFMHERQYDKAVYIFEELIKINPKEEHVAILLEKAMHAANPNLIRRCRAVAIFLWLTTALLVLLELILIRTLFKSYQNVFKYSYWMTFGMAILVWICGYLYQYWRVHRAVNQRIKVAKYKKIVL